MSSLAQIEPQQSGMGRRMPRCPIAVPVRVTVVRGGVPSAIPGRSLDLSERGIAAVLAGEVSPGDPVAVEFLLPEMGLGLHAKATVRHHAPLRSGLEFQTLSVEQRAMIRRWTHRVLTPEIAPPSAISESPFKEISRKAAGLQYLNKMRSPKVLGAAAGAIVLLFLLTWWQWQRGWRELELEAQGRSLESKIPRMSLAAGVMEPLLIHRIDPELPEGSRKAGAVLVRVVIGRDGSVIDQQPINGPSAMQRAAMDSVRYWRFQPYRVEGAPVEVETTLTVEFREQPAEVR